HEVPIFFFFFPIFPYFLRTRLNEASADLRQAVETAFREYYDGVGGALGQSLYSKEAQEKQTGQVLTRLEYENLMTGLKLALYAQVSILNFYRALSFYLDTTQDQQRGLELGHMVMDALKKHQNDKLTRQVSNDFFYIADNVGKRQLILKQYAEAETSYQKALELHSCLTISDKKRKATLKAGVLHQLGAVAEEQRQWEQAEKYYSNALEIKIEFNDRYSQASTYHQLGIVAQEQRQWEQAEKYYSNALEIFIEFNDRYSQALTYHALGGVVQEQRQLEQAEKYYNKALEIYIEFKDRFWEAGAYHQLGTVAQEQRQWEQAEKYYSNALEIYIEFNDRYSQASTYHNLGIVAQGQRQWEQAEKYYSNALEIKIEFNDRYSQASTYAQLGLLAESQEQWTQAQHYLVQALEIFYEYGDEYSSSKAFNVLAQLWQETKDNSLPAAIAKILGTTPEKVEEMLDEAV
ncbi:MAG: tetratricopeptide repeat protein, partial [Desulfobacterales bacterium]|nr:tetratricopeptide repeat protein [Desulfobacterales bacterium]